MIIEDLARFLDRLSRSDFATAVVTWFVEAMPDVVAPEERAVALTALAETHARLRLLDAGAVRQMRESLERHGQLMAVAAYRPGRGQDGPLELVDGFKRLQAARGLGWVELRVRVLPVDTVAAKVAMGVLNHGRGLSELEEAWLVRALHREDALTQPQIGRLLGRHKSWVSRRLLLAEGLDEAVQADVRLGLVAASTATAVARLPRCNQLAAAEAVMRRGLTKHQTERLITEVLARPAAERELALCESAERFPLLGDGPATGRRHGSELTPAQSLMCGHRSPGKDLRPRAGAAVAAPAIGAWRASRAPGRRWPVRARTGAHRAHPDDHARCDVGPTGTGTCGRRASSLSIKW